MNIVIIDGRIEMYSLWQNDNLQFWKCFYGRRNRNDDLTKKYISHRK